jgi:hypothetical protein
MKKYIYVPLTILLLLTFQTQSFSFQAKPDSDSLSERLDRLEKELNKLKEVKTAPVAPIQVGGQAFIYYSYTTNNGTDGKDFNKFDFDRMYLTAKGDIYSNAKFNFTSDIFRNAATGSYYAGLAMRIKFAYIDYAPTNDFSIKLGMIPTVWVGFVDTYWKYRGISSGITDKDSYFSSADLGVSASYNLPSKLGEISAFILNGSGYTAPESNRYKDYGARLTLTPFSSSNALKGLTLAGYGYKGSNLSVLGTAAQRDRFGGLFSYTYSFFSANAEYDVRKDADITNLDKVATGNGLSVFGEIKVPIAELHNKLALLWRYDSYYANDPNKDNDETRNNLAIAGVSYKLHEKVTLVLDYQATQAIKRNPSKLSATKTDNDTKLFFHSIINF